MTFLEKSIYTSKFSREVCKNISSCLQTNMCTVREYKCGRTFFVVTVIFTFRDRKEEGVMSNRAEQMSDRAEQLSDRAKRGKTA